MPSYESDWTRGKSNMKKITRFYYAESTNDNEFRVVGIDGDILVIGENAFENDETVQKVVLPTSVNTIEKNAFKNCKKLQVVKFRNVENEKSKAKDEEVNYATEKINDEETTPTTETSIIIQYQAFKDCVELHTVIFPKIENNKKLVIEKEAFTGCTALRTVVIPCEQNAEVKISADAFYGLNNVVFITENPYVEQFAREHELHYVKGE